MLDNATTLLSKFRKKTRVKIIDDAVELETKRFKSNWKSQC